MSSVVSEWCVLDYFTATVPPQLLRVFSDFEPCLASHDFVSMRNEPAPLPLAWYGSVLRYSAALSLAIALRNEAFPPELRKLCCCDEYLILA